MIELGGLIKAGGSLLVFVGIIAIFVRGFKLTSKDKKNGTGGNSSNNGSNTGGTNNQ